jgi:hypothetical protein
MALSRSGWTIMTLAPRANAFAVAVVRIPREREHAVVDAGISTISDLSSCASRPIRGLRA